MFGANFLTHSHWNRWWYNWLVHCKTFQYPHCTAIASRINWKCPSNILAHREAFFQEFYRTLRPHLPHSLLLPVRELSWTMLRTVLLCAVSVRKCRLTTMHHILGEEIFVEPMRLTCRQNRSRTQWHALLAHWIQCVSNRLNAKCRREFVQQSDTLSCRMKCFCNRESSICICISVLRFRRSYSVGRLFPKYRIWTLSAIPFTCLATSITSPLPSHSAGEMSPGFMWMKIGPPLW